MMEFVVDADPTAEWQVWYEDTFDREAPRLVVASGVGLAAGLADLWRRHLSDTVQPNGLLGFSHYNLWWKQASKSVLVVGEPAGLIRLREWIVVDSRRSLKDAADLLTAVAAVHSRQVLAGGTSVDLVEAARVARGRDSFAAQLASRLRLAG